ncbi:MAG: UDP-N-acetylglucosamine 1-carboxyvinyltransferase, partial [Clostridia bacterium]|nr:UDP-N-acetylglucosamine 1-carboxyvinyltransferase [Clostridia bacterium]
MEKLKIHGGKRLRGEVALSGCKNAALPVLYATVLTNDVSVIHNVPAIRDVWLTLEILSAMGAVVLPMEPHTFMIDTRAVTPCRSPDASVAALRASSYLLGAELGRFHKTRAAVPGGCRIGARPLDLHVLAFSALGADVSVREGAITAEAAGLTGATVSFPTPSVGATVNALLAAVMADGDTVIRGAAREPHVSDLCTYLLACGADIEGVGENTLRVRGRARLHGAEHRLMPDTIECGTLLAAVGAAGGEALVRGGVASHMEAVIAALVGMGVRVKEEGEGLWVGRSGPLSPCHLTAAPYPAFPTDMHPPMMALATVAEGESTLLDTVFPDRYAYTEELRRMGAAISATGGRVTVRGAPLSGAHVRAVDLRAGAAEVVAARA